MTSRQFDSWKQVWYSPIGGQRTSGQDSRLQASQLQLEAEEGLGTLKMFTFFFSLTCKSLHYHYSKLELGLVYLYDRLSSLWNIFLAVQNRKYRISSSTDFAGKFALQHCTYYQRYYQLRAAIA